MAKQAVVDIGENVREKRQRTLDKANEALRSKLGWILDWQSTEMSRGILGRWDLGEEIEEVVRDRDHRIYGHTAQADIATFLSEDPSLISVAKQIYHAYPDRKKLVEITEMRMQDGVTHLSYSHIRRLTGVKDEQKRHSLMNLCLENCWTSDELGRRIMELHGGSASNNPNGRASAPKTAESVIGQMLDFANDFDSRNSRIWRDPRHSLTAQVDKLEAEAYTEELAKKLGELAHRMRLLANEANMRAEEAERKYEEVVKGLKKKNAGPVTAALQYIHTENESADVTHPKRRERPVGGRKVKVG